jgi:hypothetical protein
VCCGAVRTHRNCWGTSRRYRWTALPLFPFTSSPRSGARFSKLAIQTTQRNEERREFLPLRSSFLCVVRLCSLRRAFARGRNENTLPLGESGSRARRGRAQPHLGIRSSPNQDPPRSFLATLPAGSSYHTSRWAKKNQSGPNVSQAVDMSWTR